MSKNKEKDKRIKAEDARLRKIYAGIETKKLDVLDGLIVQAARLRVTLDDLAEDLDENGYTEKFQQAKGMDPYDRKRPAADLYNTMNTSYQKAIKQLTDLLPKETKEVGASDGFEDFINGRNEI